MKKNAKEILPLFAQEVFACFKSMTERKELSSTLQRENKLLEDFNGILATYFRYFKENEVKVFIF